MLVGGWRERGAAGRGVCPVGGVELAGRACNQSVEGAVALTRTQLGMDRGRLGEADAERALAALDGVVVDGVGKAEWARVGGLVGLMVGVSGRVRAGGVRGVAVGWRGAARSAVVGVRPGWCLAGGGPGW